MEYLNKLLGINTEYSNISPNPMPNYINARYDVQEVSLDDIKAVFVYPKTELDSITHIKKHIEKIEAITRAPAVILLNHLTYRQREYLLRDHIAFIVEGKQIYLPFMAIYLRERCDVDQKAVITLLPSAQVLLLYYIYHGCGRLSTSDAVRDLKFTATSVSRASRQLCEMNLLQMEKTGVQKIIYSDKRPSELFDEAKKYIPSPVKRTIYVPKTAVNTSLPLSGFSALSEYTMLSSPDVYCYAAHSIAAWENISTLKLHNSDEQCAIEFWRYNPQKLTNEKIVDKLSLALALRNEKDERTEEAVNEMLEQTWRDIDGKRN